MSRASGTGNVIERRLVSLDEYVRESVCAWALMYRDGFYCVAAVIKTDGN
jgi:hypothetical protein